MKQSILSIAAGLALTAALPASAQLTGDGYYRGENYKTGRYIYVVDDKGQINNTSTQADLGACHLWSGFLKASSDPATILYVSEVYGKYDIAAQGTSVHKFINHYLFIRQNGTGADGMPTYMVYATDSGATRYLGDSNTAPGDQGEMSSVANGDYRKWYIIPVEASNNDRYFGIKPTLTSGGKYYQSFFTGFPYSAYSQGVKFYQVVKVDGDLAVIEEITGTVPQGTGIIAECANPLPTDNRLTIGGTGSALSSNLLKGVYFNIANGSLHTNRTKYDKKTMRILTTDANGALVYTTANIDYLPANESYLPVSSSAPATLRVVTRAEYEQEILRRPTSVTVTPSTATILVGQSVTLSGDVQPATADKALTWTSSDSKIATVDANGAVKGIGAGTATITATTVNGLKSTAKVTVQAVATSITLSQTSATLNAGETISLTATVKPDNAVDKSVTWTSSNTAVATVSDKGLVTAIAKGTATITAKTVNGLTANFTLTVRPVVESVTLSQTEATLTAGESFTLTATILPGDALQTMTWTSSDPSVATVSDKGVVKAVAKGTAAITVKSANGKTAECKVTVAPLPESVTLSKSEITLEIGESETLTATVLPEDVINKTVTWTSSNENVAKVSADGTVTALAKGVASVIATASNGVQAVCAINVRSVTPKSITVEPETLTLTRGEKGMLTVTVLPAEAADYTLTWESSDRTVATVSRTGQVNAMTPGEAVITITTSNGLTATVAVTVKDREYPVAGITFNTYRTTVVEGEEFDIVATVLPANATDKTLTWSSSDESVAVVADGHVTTLAPGAAVITATAVTGVKAECQVTVTAKEIPVIYPEAVTLSQTSLTVAYGDRITLTATVAPDDATDKSVTWTVSDENVVRADGAEGEFIAVGGGDAVITVTTVNGRNASCSVHVNRTADALTLSASTLALVKGETESLHVTVAPEDANDYTLTWTSSDEAVATVSETGRVTAVGGGEADIRVSASEEVYASASVRVTVPVEEILLDPNTIVAIEDDEVTVTASVMPVDATDKSIVWMVDNTGVTEILESDDTQCRLLIKAEGQTRLIASAADGPYAVCTIDALSGVAALLGEVGTADVYTTDGILLRRSADSDYIRTLAPGLYIIAGRKVLL